MTTQKGFTLLIAIVTTAMLLLVSVVVINIALKQLLLVSANKESQSAFYIADSGIECALYWDLKNGAISAFATTTPSISCNNQTITSGQAIPLAVPAQQSQIGAGTMASDLLIGKTATQSSDLFGGVASRAVDGNTDGNYGNGSVTHTNSNMNEWWQADFGVSTALSSIVIWNRTDSSPERLNDYWVFISDTPFGALDTPATLSVRANTWSSHQVTIPSPSLTIPTPNVQGRYVRIQMTSNQYLSLAEVQAFGGQATSLFSVNFGNGCAIVQVIKSASGATTINSKGYNTCVSSARRYERGIIISY
jgi:hypothetical protein